MIGTLILVLLILAVGTRVSDALEVRQQEIVLGKLPVGEAHDYYQRLRRRAWRARILRGVAVLALITLAYAARRLLPVDASPASGARVVDREAGGATTPVPAPR
jgi:hypothetical protein